MSDFASLKRFSICWVRLSSWPVAKTERKILKTDIISKDIFACNEAKYVDDHKNTKSLLKLVFE